MNLHNLDDCLRRLEVPDPRPERMREAREKAMAAFSESHPSGRIHFSALGKWAAGLAAGFCLVALLWLSASKDPAEAPQDLVGISLDAQFRVLAEVERLFPEQLAAILMQGENMELLLSPERTVRDQPVVVEFRRGGRTARVLTFNGSRFVVEIDGTALALDVLLTGENQIILAGPDFVWTPGRSQEIAGFTIHAFSGSSS